ncbi:MAG TPA: glycosyltransferase family 39 protein, partial [Alphaproteobacteria bacterium]|nr:glycosyltransferase family 39 protein [Alphaproteobacteria bacterium]
MTGIAIAIATFALHLCTAWRYGYFRDELYFIACGRHLAWGYVDQPPLVALVAWLAQPEHDGLIALRLLPALAAGFAAFVAVQIARDLGGGRFAQWLAGIAVALTPAYLLLGNLLTTTSFEPLSWTLVIWLVIRSVALKQPRRGTAAKTWLTIAAAASFGLYGKYSMALLLAALLAGLLATKERRILATPWLAISASVVAVVMLPNLWWQAAHGWPFLAVLQGDAAHRHAFNNGWLLESQNLAGNAISFAAEQLVYTNPLASPVWLAGLIAPFAWRRLRDLRFLSIAYVVLFATAVMLEAKGYYIIGIYGALLAMGSVVVERAAGWLRIALFAALTAAAVATMPLSIPVLSIDGFISYTRVLGLTGRDGAPAHLIQPIYAEEFGWDRLARDVASVYAALPAATRATTAIYADTYADAGAIDFFGPAHDLPSAISSQNSYWLWGTHGYDGTRLIAIGASRIDLLRRYYHSCRLIATSNEPLKWVVEGPAPIYLCTGPVMPLDQIWPHLRWYGA